MLVQGCHAENQGRFPHLQDQTSWTLKLWLTTSEAKERYIQQLLKVFKWRKSELWCSFCFCQASWNRVKGRYPWSRSNRAALSPLGSFLFEESPPLGESVSLLRTQLHKIHDRPHRSSANVSCLRRWAKSLWRGANQPVGCQLTFCLIISLDLPGPLSWPYKSLRPLWHPQISQHSVRQLSYLHVTGVLQELLDIGVTRHSTVQGGLLLPTIDISSVLMIAPPASIAGKLKCLSCPYLWHICICIL